MSSMSRTRSETSASPPTPPQAPRRSAALRTRSTSNPRSNGERQRHEGRGMESLSTHLLEPGRSHGARLSSELSRVSEGSAAWLALLGASHFPARPGGSREWRAGLLGRGSRSRGNHCRRTGTQTGRRCPARPTRDRTFRAAQLGGTDGPGFNPGPETTLPFEVKPSPGRLTAARLTVGQAMRTRSRPSPLRILTLTPCRPAIHRFSPRQMGDELPSRLPIRLGPPHPVPNPEPVTGTPPTNDSPNQVGSPESVPRSEETQQRQPERTPKHAKPTGGRWSTPAQSHHCCVAPGRGPVSLLDNESNPRPSRDPLRRAHLSRQTTQGRRSRATHTAMSWSAATRCGRSRRGCSVPVSPAPGSPRR